MADVVSNISTDNTCTKTVSKCENTNVALCATTVENRLASRPLRSIPTCFCNLPLQRYGNQHGMGQKADCGYRRFQSNLGNVRIDQCPVTITHSMANMGPCSIALVEAVFCAGSYAYST